MGSSLSKSHLPRNYWPEETGQVTPTFVYEDEIFWGDDRLEDAVDWCMSH